MRRLSGGQRQRLSLALALVGRPEVVFLDEPTAGMDPHARATTWQLVRELRDHGVTVVLTTHAMDEAEQLCDRVAIVDHGRLVACGSPAGAHDRGAGRRDRVRGRAGLDLPALAAALGLDAGARARGAPGGVRRRAPRRRPTLRRRPRDLAARPATCRSASCAPGRRSLEEVFLRLTRERATREAARARSRAQARIELLLTLRRGESLIVTLVIPLGILVFFSKVDAVNTTQATRSTSSFPACSRSR